MRELGAHARGHRRFERSQATPGRPAFLRLDNGSQFAATAVMAWLRSHAIGPASSRRADEYPDSDSDSHPDQHADPDPDTDQYVFRLSEQ
ncbi:MAG: hypothetical protein ACT4QE_21275 [Anaerolineales bacterium]